MRQYLQFALTLVFVALGVRLADCADFDVRNEVVRESLYNYLIIGKNGSTVTFRRMENGATLSEIDLANPKQQLIPYAADLFAACLIKPDPRNALSIGMGAAAFNRLFVPTYPSAMLTTVEIDSMIVEAAERFTAYQQGANDKVVVSDGRRFLARDKRLWDWIVLDAFVRRSMVPPHLTTTEFYRLASSRMTPDGVFVVNILRGTDLFASNIKTLISTFAQVVLIPIPKRENVIALAVNYTNPDLFGLIRQRNLSDVPNIMEFGVDFQSIKQRMQNAQALRIPSQTRLLTDDFAPVEYLDLQTTK